MMSLPTCLQFSEGVGANRHLTKVDQSRNKFKGSVAKNWRSYNAA